MTMIASMIYMFFAFHVIIYAPHVGNHKVSPSVEKKSPTASRESLPAKNITTTQTISATKPAETRLNQLDLYHRVAARSLGEGSSALAEIACTVKNRLRVSRSPLSVVLKAYYARDKPPKPEHIEIVRKVFEGELPCPETWWYALSPRDTRRFRPHPRPVFIIKRDPRHQIWIYER